MNRSDNAGLHGLASDGLHNQEKYRSLISSGKRVLINGAAGYIGSAIAMKVASSCAAPLVLFDISESGIYQLERYLPYGAASRVLTVLGDVCDRAFLDDVLLQHQPQIILHAAACKHLPLLERNPRAAIKNNVLGTAAITRAAIAHGCEQLILVSTDKATDPTSIMGASKRVAELILLTTATKQTRCKAVRLGNVINSPGSVAPLFAEQLASNVPITVTHPDVRRYFMTIDEAVDALLEASSEEYETGLFVPRLEGPTLLTELARSMHASRNTDLPSEPQIAFTGLRPGEKLNEVLIGAEEQWSSTPEGVSPSQLRRVHTPLPASNLVTRTVQELTQTMAEWNSAAVLKALQRLIPAYEPSSTLVSSLEALSSVR